MFKFKREQLYYIAHPKTATSSTATVMTKSGYWEQIGTRHDVQPYPHNGKVKIISVIRNPMDWFVSWHSYKLQRNSGRRSFPVWLKEFKSGFQIGGLHFYGYPLSTHVIFFHDLQRGWDAVMDDLGKERIVLPHLNKGELRKPNLSDYYDNKTMEIFLRVHGDFFAWYHNVLALKGDEPFLKRSP